MFKLGLRLVGTIVLSGLLYEGFQLVFALTNMASDVAVVSSLVILLVSILVYMTLINKLWRNLWKNALD